MLDGGVADAEEWGGSRCAFKYLVWAIKWML